MILSIYLSATCMLSKAIVLPGLLLACYCYRGQNRFEGLDKHLNFPLLSTSQPLDFLPESVVDHPLLSGPPTVHRLMSETDLLRLWTGFGRTQLLGTLFFGCPPPLMVMMRGCSVGTGRANVLVAYPTERAGNAVDRRYATFSTVSSMVRTQLLGDVKLAGAQVVVAFMIRHLHHQGLLLFTPAMPGRRRPLNRDHAAGRARTAHGSRAQALRGDVAAARVPTHRGLAERRGALELHALLPPPPRRHEAAQGRRVGVALDGAERVRARARPGPLHGGGARGPARPRRRGSRPRHARPPRLRRGVGLCGAGLGAGAARRPHVVGELRRGYAAIASPASRATAAAPGRHGVGAFGLLALARGLPLHHGVRGVAGRGRVKVSLLDGGRGWGRPERGR
uniref:Uncharacterized protein n=1 Tax=Zea mays TaxID=4577 RepID=B7ZZQ7_MAIZE|nr:unknown [Zea mays]